MMKTTMRDKEQLPAAPFEMDLSEGAIGRIIEEALREDIGLGDVTTAATVSDELQCEAEILIKESGIVAGLEIASHVFAMTDERTHFEQFSNDGERVAANHVAARIQGFASKILEAERTALNFLQRMSGIATLTAQYVDAIRGTRAHIIDTRKTAPGLRMIDKIAVRLGGGFNHRFGLDDMVLIKDNHIAACGGSVGEALHRANQYLISKNLQALKVEIETKSLEEVDEVLRIVNVHQGASLVHRIMLDNFPVDNMKEAVRRISRRLEIEASGGITLTNVREVAETGVDFISVGALTHSPKALDISLNITHRITS